MSEEEQKEEQENPEQESESVENVISSRKRKILVFISAACSTGVAVYMIYSLVISGPGVDSRKADALLREKRYEEAINFYNIALRKKPKFPKALIGLGSALDAIGKPDEAIRCLDEAISINPGIAKAWNSKGSALYTLGKLDEALKCYDEALRIDPKYGNPWANKASILRLQKKYEEARLALDNYIKLEAKGLKVNISIFSIEDIIKRISPLIENVTGLPYKKEVKVKLITPYEIENLAKRNLLRQFKNLFPGVNTMELEKQAQSLSELYSAVICARYDVADKILYIVPDNFQMDVVLLKIDRSKINPLLDLLVGHELVHALQDQQFGIWTKMLTIKNSEEKYILDCVTEGHAFLTIEQVSEKMGLDKDIAELSSRVSAGDFREASPFDRMAAQYVTSSFNQVHLKGLEFIRFVHSREGNQGIAKVFKNPPVKVSAILRPQTYYQKPLKEIDYARVLGAVESFISGTSWKKGSMQIREMSLRAGLSAWVPPKKLEEALAGFEEGFLLTYAGKEESIISMAVLRFNNSKDADGFFEASNESTQNQWNMIKNSPGRNITILQNNKFSIPKARKAIIREAEISPSPDQRTHPLNVLVAFENFILDISFINYKIEEGDIRESVSKIFEELDSELKQEVKKI